MLVLVTMGILYTLVSQVSLVGKRVARAEGTSAAMLQAKEALIGYAATYRDTHPGDVFGYLPCPDINGDGSADALSSDCGGADGRAVIGLLPYKQLGLPSNQDADGNCLWYAVSGTFKASANPNLPAPMNWDTQGQVEVRDANNGLIAQPNDANGGAAAVIFSVGIPNAPQTQLAITPAAICGVSSSSRANVYYANYIDVDPVGIDPAKSQPFPGPVNTTIRVVRGTIGSSINNDQLLLITPKEIWARIKARNDFPVFINSVISNIQSALNIAPSLPAPAVGNNLPSLPTTPPIGVDPSFYNNWKDNFRYRVCVPQNTYCYQVNSIRYDGVLIFSGVGNGLTGSNNTSSPRAATSRNDINYFENALALVNGLPTPINSTTSYNSISPNDSTDLVLGLKQEPTTLTITNAQMFNTGNASVSGHSLTSANGTTLTLGNTNIGGVSPSELYGCFWYPTSIPFGTGLRVYFEYVTVNQNEGFTFALADADPGRNASVNSMCGASADALGYAGNNGVTNPIRYPKIALKFDFRRSNPGALGINRNDPTGPPQMHFAFDYWGNGTTDPNGNDDVTHSAGNGVSDPTNPASGQGLRRFNSNTSNNTKFFVRFDITRNYPSSPLRGNYKLDAYVVRASNGSVNYPGGIPCSPGITLLQSYIRDTTQDLSSLCPDLITANSSSLRYLTNTVTINDLSGLSEAMQRIYMGFTTSQSNQPQQITLSNFQAATR
jgi:hypothetical protein